MAVSARLTFLTGSSIEAGGYLVVARNPVMMTSEFAYGVRMWWSK